MVRQFLPNLKPDFRSPDGYGAAQLRFTGRARNDLYEISAFIARSSPVNAARFIAKLEGHCWLLASHPLIGQLRDELAPDLRSFPVEKYLIFFRPTTGGAEVLRIIHGARDLRQALNESRHQISLLQDFK